MLRRPVLPDRLFDRTPWSGPSVSRAHRTVLQGGRPGRSGGSWSAMSLSPRTASLVCRHDQCDSDSTTDPDPARVGQSMRELIHPERPSPAPVSSCARRDQGALRKDGWPGTPPRVGAPLDKYTNYDQAKQSSRMQAFSDQGVRIIAPPMYALLEVKNGEIVPSLNTRGTRRAQSWIFSTTWTLECSGRLADLAPKLGTTTRPSRAW